MTDIEKALAATRAANGTDGAGAAFCHVLSTSIHHEGMTRQETADLARKLRGIAAQLWELADGLAGTDQTTQGGGE